MGKNAVEKVSHIFLSVFGQILLFEFVVISALWLWRIEIIVYEKIVQEFVSLHHYWIYLYLNLSLDERTQNQESIQTSKMELFVKIINDWKP